MKKMNIRQAFAKMKKMFPRNYTSTRKDFLHFSSGNREVIFYLYTDKPQPTIAKSNNSFEEAFEKLDEQLRDLR